MSATLLMFHPKCTQCDETFPAGAQFCVHCGRPIHTTEEELGPPAQIHPLRPSAQDDSFRLPAPPATSALSPLATDSLLIKASADQVPDASPEEEALSETPAQKNTSAALVEDKAKDSWDEGAPSPESLPDLPLVSEEAIQEEENEEDEDDDALIVPKERSFRPWLVKGGALLAALLLVYVVWPKESVEQRVSTPKPSLSPVETPAPIMLPAADQPEEAPEVKEAPPKPQSLKHTKKTSHNNTDITTPQPPAPKSGKLKPSDVAPKLPLDDASQTSPEPKETPAPKPTHTTEADDEAADFLTGE